VPAEVAPLPPLVLALLVLVPVLALLLLVVLPPPPLLPRATRCCSGSAHDAPDAASHRGGTALSLRAASRSRRPPHGGLR